LKEEILTTIITFLIIAAILVGGIWFMAHNKEQEHPNMSPLSGQKQNVREPAVAGQFYPADAKELANQVDGFWRGRKKSPPALL